MRLFLITTIATILFLILMGCSSGNGGMNPLIPGMDSNSSVLVEDNPIDSAEYPIADLGEEAINGESVFAMYNLELNADQMSASLSSIRNNSALGDVFQADITNFLSSICRDCLQVVGVGLTEGDAFLEVTFRLHHPIPIPKSLSEPKPSDRLDLHLFDVRGMIFSEGDRIFTGITSDINGDGTAAEVLRCNPELVQNADGYSTFFDTFMDANVKQTSANLHPYRLFFADPKTGNYNPDINPTNGWITLTTPQGQNVFPQGDRTSDTTYIFKVPTGQTLNLVMLMDACYGQSSKFSIPNPEVGSRMNPRYFLPQFHRKEAWKAFVNINNNTLAHGAVTSSATITVTVYDWQAGLAGAGVLDYFTAELNHLTLTSDVDKVQVFVPELIAAPNETPLSSIGKGVWTDPYVYTFEIKNDLDAVGGKYYGIVAIRDSLELSGKGPLGSTRDNRLVKITDFTNYQIFPIEVAAFPPNQMPLALFTTDPPFPQINSGQSVTFDATPSMDPDGEIVSYEWDFEFTGIFDIDATGATPAPHMYINQDPSRPALFFAALRVKDNGDPPLEGLFGSEVFVLPNAPPVAVIKVTPISPFSECDLVTLDGTQSHDDGSVESYEWDLNYDFNNPIFHAEETGSIIEKRFSPGTHDIMLRVTDNSSPPLEGITRIRLVSEPLTGTPGQLSFCDNYLLNEEDSLNSHSFAGGGQRGLVLTPTNAVIACWVDEGDVAGGPAIKYSSSMDGGRTFSAPLNANSSRIAGDSSGLRPTLAVDQLGSLQLAYADGDGKYYYQQTRTGGGLTDPIEVGIGTRDYGGPAVIKGMDGIYYFYTGNEVGGSVPLLLARSTDGGTSFDSPITVAADGKYPSVSTTNTGSIILVYEGRNAGLSDNSDILASYQRSSTIFYPPIRIVDSLPNDGLSTNPSVLVGMDGTIHVTWQDSREGENDSEYDIYYAYTVTGLSFSRNTKVNDSVESAGSRPVQDHPVIGLSMMGVPFIAWRDFRNGTGGDIYMSFQRMLGMAFEANVKVNDDNTSSPNISHGPPSMIVSSNAGLLLMWGDERNAASDLGTPFSGPSDMYYVFGRLF